MIDLLFAVAGLATAILVIWSLFWVVVEVPRDMAKERNRDPVAWVLVSIFGSPVLAIFLLWLLGEAET